MKWICIFLPLILLTKGIRSEDIPALETEPSIGQQQSEDTGNITVAVIASPGELSGQTSDILNSFVQDESDPNQKEEKEQKPTKLDYHTRPSHQHADYPSPYQPYPYGYYPPAPPYFMPQPMMYYPSPYYPPSQYYPCQDMESAEKSVSSSQSKMKSHRKKASGSSKTTPIVKNWQEKWQNRPTVFPNKLFKHHKTTEETTTAAAASE